MGSRALIAVAVMMLALAGGCRGAGERAPADISDSLTSPSGTTSPDESVQVPVDLTSATAEAHQTALQLVRSGIPGVLIVLTDGPEVQIISEGVAVRGVEVPPSPDQPSRIASLTKPMVATAVLRLVEQGDLALDDTLAEILPGVVPDAAEITITELLSHSSGLPEITGPIMGRAEPWSNERTLRVLSRLEAVETTFSNYTNTNYILLGLVIEELTGDTLADSLSALTFEPAGMTNTAVLSRVDVDSVGHGYSGPRDETGLVLRTAHAGGGAVASARDVDRFMIALSNGSLLPDNLVTEMTTGRGQSMGTFDDYGLGIATLNTNCGPALGHSGRLAGYTSEMWWLADSDRRVVVFLNSDAEVANGGAYALVHAALCG